MGERLDRAGESCRARRNGPAVIANADGAGLTIFVLCLGAALVPVAPLAAQTRDNGAPAEAVSAPIATVEQALGVLRSPESPEADRRAAAGVIVSRPMGPDWAGPVIEALDPGVPPGSRVALAGAIGALGQADPTVLGPLGRMLGDTDASVARAGFTGLQAFRSKDAVRAVIEWLNGPRGVPGDGLTEAAVECLKAQTGMVENGSDPAAWVAWWERSQFLRDSEWRGQVADAQARRAAAAIDANRRMSRALTDLYRRLYSSRPDEERSDLLAEMIQSETAEVREAGLDLVQRRLLNASPVNEAAVRATIARLSDSRPAIRAQAARILERMDRTEAVEPVFAALSIERDPEAAAALLRAAARRPDARLPSHAMVWFGGPSLADTAALEALLACANGSVLSDEVLMGRVREGLLSREEAALPAPGMALIARLGEWDRIVPLLLAEDRARARGAARALEGVEHALDELVAAAALRPDLAPIAIGALQRFRPNAEGLADAVALASSAGEDVQERLHAFAGALPPDELLRFARGEREPAVIDAVVGPVLTPAYLARPESPVDRVELAMTVARAQLALGRAGEALEVIDALPFRDEGPRLVALRVEALLRLNRLREAVEASEFDGDEDARRLVSQGWLNALTASAQEVFAPSLAREFLDRYSGSLTGRQRTRFEALLELIGLEGPPEPDADASTEAPAPQE